MVVVHTVVKNTHFTTRTHNVLMILGLSLCCPLLTSGAGVCERCPMNMYCYGVTIMNCTDNSRSPYGSNSSLDCVCKVGYTGPNGGPCTACPAGSFKIIPYGDCIDCPEGTVSGNGSTSCTSCPTNMTTDVNDVLKCSCNKGYGFSVNGVCQKCSTGEYKDVIGNLTCTQCPLNSRSSYGSNSSLDCDCKIGYSGPKGGPCTACPAGSFKSIPYGDCIDCPEGTVSDAGSISCTPTAVANVTTAAPVASTTTPTAVATTTTTAAALVTSTTAAALVTSTTPAPVASTTTPTPVGNTTSARRVFITDSAQVVIFSIMGVIVFSSLCAVVVCLCIASRYRKNMASMRTPLISKDLASSVVEPIVIDKKIVTGFMLNTRLNLEEYARIVLAKANNILQKPVMKVVITVNDDTVATVATVPDSSSDTENVETQPSLQSLVFKSRESKSFKAFDVVSDKKKGV
jgi:hypothetical protein